MPLSWRRTFNSDVQAPCTLTSASIRLVGKGLFSNPGRMALNRPLGVIRLKLTWPDNSSTRRTKPSISTQCESKRPLAKSSRSTCAGVGQVGHAQDFDLRTKHFRRKTAGTGAARQFNPLAGLDLFLGRVQVHVNGVAAGPGGNRCASRGRRR